MRRLVLVLAAFFTLSLSAFAIGLQWDANPTSDQVTKYTVYQGSSVSGPWTKLADVPAPTTTYTLTGLTPGIYYFCVSASNIWTESGKSNIVNTPALPTLPKNLIIIAVIINQDGTFSSRALTPDELFRFSGLDG